jgi:hypothetical protein
MTKQFQQEHGDWKQFRSRFNLSESDEVDLHLGERDPDNPYENAMADVIEIVQGNLRHA